MTPKRTRRILRLLDKGIGKDTQSPVVSGLPGELLAETLARLEAEGRAGPFIVLPRFADRASWERATAAYQRWLLSRAADEQLSSEEIEAAQSAAIAGTLD